jgi:hypothetical protein
VELGKKRDSSRDVQTQKTKNTSPWGGDWVEYTTDEGRKYYHNAATGVTRWHIPTFDLAAQLSAKAAEKDSHRSSTRSKDKVSRACARTLLPLITSHQNCFDLFHLVVQVVQLVQLVEEQAQIEPHS